MVETCVRLVAYRVTDTITILCTQAHVFRRLHVYLKDALLDHLWLSEHHAGLTPQCDKQRCARSQSNGNRSPDSDTTAVYCSRFYSASTPLTPMLPSAGPIRRERSSSPCIPHNWTLLDAPAPRVFSRFDPLPRPTAFGRHSTQQQRHCSHGGGGGGGAGAATSRRWLWTAAAVTAVTAVTASANTNTASSPSGTPCSLDTAAR